LRAASPGSQRSDSARPIKSSAKVLGSGIGVKSTVKKRPESEPKGGPGSGLNSSVSTSPPLIGIGDSPFSKGTELLRPCPTPAEMSLTSGSHQA